MGGHLGVSGVLMAVVHRLRQMVRVDVRPSSEGWTLAAYWTPVEREYPREHLERLTGADGAVDLGTHDAGFVDDVAGRKGKAARRWGRVASPFANGEEYLGWDGARRCFTTSSAPRDAMGKPLVPFVTMAADPSVVKPGTLVHIADCGTNAGVAVDPQVAARLVDSAWVVTDTGVSGRRVDMYIGEQDRADMAASPFHLSLEGAMLRLF
jgi:3D (Asp-Asp-Asp) domain-containing protein